MTRKPRWQEKPCSRPLCGGTVRIFGRPSRFKKTRYHSQRCATLAYAAACQRGRDQAVIRCAVADIQQALGLSGEPPQSLVQVVRRLRSRFYRQGWQVVERKMRRAIASGRLVDSRRPTGAAA